MRVEGDEGGGGGGVRGSEGGGVRGSDRKRLEKEREGDDLDSCRTVSQLSAVTLTVAFIRD